jgi:hypothetical protein
VRYSIKSTPFAESLFTILQPHLPEFPFPASQRKGSLTRPAHSFNSNIRLYKYLPGHRFGQHYDDSVTDVNTGAVSEWTLLIYLTGEEDGVRGGEVRCFKQRCLAIIISIPRPSFTNLMANDRPQRYAFPLGVAWHCYIGTWFTPNFTSVSSPRAGMVTSVFCMKARLSWRAPSTSYGRISCLNRSSPWECEVRISYIHYYSF